MAFPVDTIRRSKNHNADQPNRGLHGGLTARNDRVLQGIATSCEGADMVGLETKGFEPSANSCGKAPNSRSRGTESGTLGHKPGNPPHPIATDGAELRTVIDSWPSLPAALRARILGMVEGATAARMEG